jgi:hypothetical protein
VGAGSSQAVKTLGVGTVVTRAISIRLTEAATRWPTYSDATPSRIMARPTITVREVFVSRSREAASQGCQLASFAERPAAHSSPRIARQEGAPVRTGGGHQKSILGSFQVPPSYVNS